MNENIQIKNKPINEQELENELEGLLAEAGKIKADMDELKVKTEGRFDEIEKSVDGYVADVEKIYSELDQAEERAGEELDKLMLEQIDDLSSDDEKDEE